MWLTTHLPGPHHAKKECALLTTAEVKSNLSTQHKQEHQEGGSLCSKRPSNFKMPSPWTQPFHLHPLHCRPLHSFMTQRRKQKTTDVRLWRSLNDRLRVNHPTFSVLITFPSTHRMWPMDTLFVDVLFFLEYVEIPIFLGFLFIP